MNPLVTAIRSGNLEAVKSNFKRPVRLTLRQEVSLENVKAAAR